MKSTSTPFKAKDNSMKLTFLGATETVTGSKYLVENGKKKILVDCGLFQGLKELRLRNWDRPPVDPTTVDAIVLTHAHIDHTGYIPKFVKAGFQGPIYCSEATYDLCRILLPDSGYLQEEDAKQANMHHYSRHHPALPLYSKKDAEACLELFQPVTMGEEHHLSDQLKFSLHHAGHILGSCFVRMIAENGPSILFSGDLGRMQDPVMRSPAKIQQADYIVVESTYGDRLHDTRDPTEQIAEIVKRTAARGGTVLIPAFAVGRAQSLLYHLYLAKKRNMMPDLPIYLDSPMSINATELLNKHMAEHRLSKEECAAVCEIAEYTRTVDQSKAINETNNMPKVIISASGMATGGRILHHLKHYLGDPRSAILLAGFQASGTRGDRLARGEEEIKIHGQMWPVRAEIIKMDNMSSHADYNETLSWLENFTSAPHKVYITHGEITAANSLKEKIEEKFGWQAVVPSFRQTEYI
jgi:metallo-beta-lactamase family protein